VAVADPTSYVRCVISIDEPVIEKLKLVIPDSTSLDFLEEAGETLPVKVHLSGEEHEKFIMHIKEYMRLEQAEDCLLLTAKLFEILAFIKYSFQTVCAKWLCYIYFLLILSFKIIKCELFLVAPTEFMRL
jgi:hypothetical protein